MGLDISYYRQAKHAPDAAVDEDGSPVDWDRFTRIYANPAFPGREDDLIDRAIYETEDGDGFPAGSYGGYNNWREKLAALAGYPKAEGELNPHSAAACLGLVGPGQPFFELVNFSDCEGVIGAKTSAKLAEDFKRFQSQADSHADDYFRAKYAEWRAAFETAADGGFVDFH